MITLNEGHNMRAVLQNLLGWAQEVFIVGSYSRDDTIDIALEFGVRVVQRRFRGFGDQWNFALTQLPISSPWTMKLDPDERLTDDLKREVRDRVRLAPESGFVLSMRLHFMARPMPIRLHAVRLWRTGKAVMSDVIVNEHVLVDGSIGRMCHDIEHQDSPDLDHWLEKQNRYTTAEAVAASRAAPLSDMPRLLGNQLQRRMWLKQHFWKLPFRYSALFVYYFLVAGAWRAGWAGYAWSRLRADVMRLIEYKRKEIALTGRLPAARQYGPGSPDARVEQVD